jgi:hypothetical protein
MVNQDLAGAFGAKPLWHQPRMASHKKRQLVRPKTQLHVEAQSFALKTTVGGWSNPFSSKGWRCRTERLFFQQRPALEA